MSVEIPGLKEADVSDEDAQFQKLPTGIAGLDQMIARRPAGLTSHSGSGICGQRENGVRLAVPCRRDPPVQSSASPSLGSR